MAEHRPQPAATATHETGAQYVLPPDCALPSALPFPPHCHQLALLLHFVSASVCLSCLFCFDPLILSGCLAGIRIRNSQFAFVALFLLLFLFPLPLHAVRPPQTDRQRKRGRGGERGLCYCHVVVFAFSVCLVSRSTLHHHCRSLALFTSI